MKSSIFFIKKMFSILLIEVYEVVSLKTLEL